MSSNFSSGPKKSGNRANFGKKKRYYKPGSNPGKKSGAPSGPKRSGSGQGQKGAQKRPIITFDPSLFIKKVEEQVASAAYVPKNMFQDFALEAQLTKNILNKGYTAPTPIQDQAIPVILQGKDIIATANTGTGKTAAFLIPLVHNVVTKKTDRVLIVAPTRELADQIYQELNSFKTHLGLSAALCIGGANINMQMKQLERNPAFVIGTPGRLMDLEEQGAINFNQYHAIVLDEVDRMLDMGFIKDIQHIIRKLPAKRHSLFFSATIPNTVKSLMDGFLKNPVSISVKTRQSAANVNQDILKVGGGSKIELLHDLLIKPECVKSIIFVRTKRAADKLTKALTQRGFTAAVIHGDKTQAQRNRSLLLFKTDKVKILVATDVVARGIDIDDISHVINYDLPQTYEDYIHRIGRTGRADKVGQAITFVE